LPAFAHHQLLNFHAGSRRLKAVLLDPRFEIGAGDHAHAMPAKNRPWRALVNHRGTSKKSRDGESV